MTGQMKNSKNWATFLSSLAFLVSLLSLGMAGLTLLQMSQLRQEISGLKQVANTPPTVPNEAPKDPAATTSATSEQPVATAQPTPAPQPNPNAKIYQSQGIANGDTFTVTLKELKRTGNTIVANFSFTNNETRGAITLGKELAKNNKSAADENTISATYLIDPTNQKKYEVMRDASNNPICTRVDGYVRNGQTVDMYAQFTAPPASTKTMNVYFPQAGPFTDVPIQ
jgi:hypothetical protein